jgi:hypothetical protein
MRDPTSVEPQLRRLREVGVRLAIDDFGAGHSSLSRLRDLDVDLLKIDRTFLDGVGDDERAARLVRATLDLAEALDTTAVAEGVETEDQRDVPGRPRLHAGAGLPPRPAPAGLRGDGVARGRLTSDVRLRAIARAPTGGKGSRYGWTSPRRPHPAPRPGVPTTAASGHPA